MTTDKRDIAQEISDAVQKTPYIGILVAVSKNGVIGKDNTIPWFHKGDLKLFKELTTDQIIIMGRKTWDSLPKKPLPKRVNIVISSDPDAVVAKFAQDYPDATELPVVVESWEAALTRANEFRKGTRCNIWAIGGAWVYEDALNCADVLVRTLVPEEIEGEDVVHFPMSEGEEEFLGWLSTSRTEHPYAEGCELEILQANASVPFVVCSRCGLPLERKVAANIMDEGFLCAPCVIIDISTQIENGTGAMMCSDGVIRYVVLGDEVNPEDLEE